MDAGAMDAQSTVKLSQTEMNDVDLADQVCKARTWPAFFKMPPQFMPVSQQASGPPEEHVSRLFDNNPSVYLPGGASRDDPAVQLLSAENDEGPETLKCLYKNAKGVKQDFYFWPGTPPRNIDEIISKDKTKKLRFIGKTALKHCPKTLDEANRLRNQVLRSYGFSPSD